MDASADPYAGSIAGNGKLIYSPTEAGENLIRSGDNFTLNNYGVLDDGVLNYGFWTVDTLAKSYYINQVDGSTFFRQGNLANFREFSVEQKAAADLAAGLWDDLVDITLQRVEITTADVTIADITFGNSIGSPGSGASAFMPFGSVYDDYYDPAEYNEIGRLGGDVWINRTETANFVNPTGGTYALQTIIHEMGHSFGLSHGGDYNASDDKDGDGKPDPITYANDAYFFQDSLQYSVMSYWGADKTGAATIDWYNLSFVYPATPMLHDVVAAQMVHGADMTTRTGDTVYGFNSTADRSVFDFNVTELPVITIWDAGGNDTLDFSGWNSNSVMDLNEGAFSSGGGTGLPSLKYMQDNFYGPTFTQAQYDSLVARYNSPDGMLHDNISIAYGAQIENAIGGGGNDTIIGNALANRLVGNGGDDVISGGDGLDVVSLGAGDDVFVAEVGQSTILLKGPNKGNMSVDIITDFDANGDDLIDVSDLDVFNFKGTSANKNAGDLTFKTFSSVNGAENALGFDIDGNPGAGVSGPVTVVYGNTNGGNADFAIVLLNTSSVSADDFLFDSPSTSEASMSAYSSGDYLF
ncbi:MAG: M10 family metallopeptidase C-terminal domain-containing protein [Pseudomonadota bacterium]|nr:M10 family metallopeptidase C-terminal domain-containing protein [Pseudomonadota bacterium]